MKEVRIKYALPKMIKYGVISLLFVIACVYILTTVIEHYHDTGYQSTRMLRYKNFSLVISIIGILLFGSGFIGLFYCVLKRKADYLFLNQDGIYIYSLTGTVFIDWGEIKGIGRHSIYRLEFIGINVRNVKKFKLRLPPLKRLLLKMNKNSGNYAIDISLNMIKMSPEQVFAIMNKYLDEWRKNNE